jgi:hypothetical protein
MQLLTKAIIERLPALGATDAQGLPAIAYVRCFTPDSSWTWYAAEFDGTDMFWGLVIGHYKEFGTFSLSELHAVRGKLGLPIERDRHFKPTPLTELFKQCPNVPEG